jgi:drug/metabolite transporter (DMT)-like permease
VTLGVFLTVLAAAAMHATWNALVKARQDRFASISLTSLGMSLAALPALPFVEIPARHVWPWIAASLAIHVGYRFFLARAYESGDLAQAYPLARGAAPLLTTLGAIVLLNELPGPIAFSGIAVLSLGTVLMATRPGAPLDGIRGRAVTSALTTSLFIAAYTLVDGTGARLASTATSYAAWHFFLDGLISMAIAFSSRGKVMLPVMAREWKAGIAAGVLSAAAYWIAIVAMTKAPIAMVAALRETSILFAMAISLFFLGEPAVPRRFVAAGLIVAGVIALRMG